MLFMAITWKLFLPVLATAGSWLAKTACVTPLDLNARSDEGKGTARLDEQPHDAEYRCSSSHPKYLRIFHNQWGAIPELDQCHY